MRYILVLFFMLFMFFSINTSDNYIPNDLFTQDGVTVVIDTTDMSTTWGKF